MRDNDRPTPTARSTAADGTPQPGDVRPIGVFDSGVGGLTVARALMDLLPDERLTYVGDTAWGPYGPRPLDAVRERARSIVDWLASQDAKLVVAACNTATAAAFSQDPIATTVPVEGVVTPAVRTAVRATRTGEIGVIGTVGTIRSRAYEQAVAAASPEVRVHARACPDFVDFAERGRTTDPGVRAAATEALAPLRDAGVDTLILGCTHYPLLTGVIGHVMGPDVLLVSSAEETARRVFGRLVDEGLDARAPQHVPHRFVVSGDGAVFRGLASRFLGPRLADVGDAAAVMTTGLQLPEPVGGTA
ncbi:glutamate racemase [Egibacter rhizosphaerae]|uniref:Glutamate racemase n=1 Tax=Egibacter rhizosphaerae TaxID=1670831 RepID=A0A411YC10_9ACTN|nr:glutamate racemase [Egibacter rhizosphaerae]QBI18740.1 glutamate racemase [Egibacter rhizosphaerae]